jgi:malate dehydrogenase (quinone)
LVSAENVHYDVVLVGGGIMSATLGMLLRRLQPDWSILVLERLDGFGLESSSAWNNAGTGHAGLCEFNYTPRAHDGTVDVAGAIAINEQFALSLQFWTHLAEGGALGDPADFIHPVPHYSFARGNEGVEHLRSRYEALHGHPLFDGMELTQDRSVMAEWLPLMFGDRTDDEPMAVCRTRGGTDVDYGTLTRRLFAAMAGGNIEMKLAHEVRALECTGQSWQLRVRNVHEGRECTVDARFVFLGAGGGTLPLLQSADEEATQDYAGFPISGQFLRTANRDLVDRHRAKVYSHAEPGSPPMSVPHLDTRVVDGRTYLMFGPFAAFSPRFLKQGKVSDLARTVNRHNVRTLSDAARSNFDLLRYLVGQIAQTRRGRLRALRRFVPEARSADWELITAGQRVQVVKQVGGRGTIANHGTETVISSRGGLAALLGASPGASASVSIALDVLERSFPEHLPAWQSSLRTMLPGYGAALADRHDLRADLMQRSAVALGLTIAEEADND